MSVFYSTVSRRTFMKNIGLAGAGIGATAALAPSFNDLDELVSDSQGGQTFPWWVKQRPLENPTVEVDWSLMQRFDASKCTNGGKLTQYVSTDKQTEINTISSTSLQQWLTEKRPGFTLRDRALQVAPSGVSAAPWTTPKPSFSATGSGVPNWQGTPEENSRMLRSALKFFGATLIGYTELTANVKKMIYTKQYSSPWADFTMENVDLAYETTTKQVIPMNKQMFIVTVMSPVCLESIKTVPGPLSSRTATGNTNNIMAMAFNRVQGFLASLGYQCICGTQNGVGSSPAFAAMSGLAEASRRTDAVSPDFGMAMRAQKFLTDLPLVSTPPIDAGVWRFCGTCKKCADVCPSGAISFDSQTTWDSPNPWQTPGRKQFAWDGVKCQVQRSYFGGECSLCMGLCFF